MQLNMRPYQATILDMLRAGFAEGHRAQMLYGPCAFGKTEVAINMMHAAQAKGTRSAMVVDRRILCEQTSARMAKYGIDHGVMMAESGRWRPELPIQICTAQTLEAREGFPEIGLLIVDEAHCQRESTTEFIKNHPKIKVIGLSGSPFTKGLGSVYSKVQSATTIAEMVKDNWLVEPRVFIAKQIDMAGAKKVAGEWSANDATKRGIQITGDVVGEWVKKTMEIFGGPRKTIVFCAGVAHGEDLSKGFADVGYNFVSISYRDDDQYKQEVLAEFERPDTSLHGIIATDILTKGFDQSDVQIAISARPFSKSFSSHVQQLGRLMRPYEGKQAIWLCHSGNYLRFRDQWDALCEDGVTELDDGIEKAKPEPSDKEKEAAKCPQCGYLWSAQEDVCPNCGHVRTRCNDVVEVAGEMVELSGARKGKNKEFTAAEKQQWYSELLYLESTWKVKKYFAYAMFIQKFGHQPHGYRAVSMPAGQSVIGWCKSRFIAASKRPQNA